jgi:hypothetical protein
MNRLSKFLDENAILFAPACFVIIFLLLLNVSAQAATVLFPSGGGLGNNVAPTLGTIPVGTSGGVYAPTSTISGPITVTGTSMLATTTTASLNGTIIVDGVHYAKTDVGIQSAINACSNLLLSSASCGGVLRTSGTSTISNSIILKSGVNLFGEGDATVLWLANGVSKAVISTNSGTMSATVRNFTVHDLKIDGNKANNSTNDSKRRLDPTFSAAG